MFMSNSLDLRVVSLGKSVIKHETSSPIAAALLRRAVTASPSPVDPAGLLSALAPRNKQRGTHQADTLKR